MFREKYKRDNELIKAPPLKKEDLMKMMQRAEKQHKSGIRPAIIAAACLMMAVLAAAAAVLGKPQNAELSEPPAVSMGDMRSAGDYSDIYSLITQLRSKQNDVYNYGMMTDDFLMTDSAVAIEDSNSYFAAGELKESATAPTSAAGTARGEYSETNTQSEGVDEADIIKTDGRYIYRKTGLKIVIIDPESMTAVSCIEPDPLNAEEKTADGSFWISELYILGDRLMVLYTKDIVTGNDWYYKSSCGVMIYDITDRNAPALISCLAQDGTLSSSRLIGDHLYLISSYHVRGEASQDQPETYVPCIEANGVCSLIEPRDICILPDPNTVSYLVMTSVSISSCEKFDSIEATLGYAASVYADTETILLSCSQDNAEQTETQIDGRTAVVTANEPETRIIRFRINAGEITPAGDCTVPGTLLNQFSIDRYNGIIRVVTTRDCWKQTIFTDGIDQYEYESFTTNGLYTLDDELRIIGKLDGLAEDERVYSVRFSGDIGYFVTFRQVDPLFAVDLSDPTAPTILSALKIPGFSQYMHPYADGLLFGLGMDADEETGRTKGLKLSMFDVSDPANVTERHKLIMDDTHWSEALYNHKAIMVYSDRNIIAFPAGAGYMIYGYDSDGFHKRFELELSDEYYHSNLRGVFIGNSFYICSDTVIYRYDMTTFEKLGELVINTDTDIYGKFCY